ncbi:GcrA family cell cycle regulator [Mangrovicella endophytica]|uniref:GcrA family cell cycle regulator n=1 Tax=Mangrovicella endophytica TaxID=2066697 RepID=UPI000C9DB332|nr:GcrA family cell cycle regulator [Mangrovicella endophytica]
MSWNDERVDLLRRLWTEGLSASQIADRLGGGVSRNAVIGKVHRLKLESRGKSTVSAPAVSTAAEVVAAEAVTEVVEVIVPARVVAAQPVMRSITRTVGATALKMEPVLVPVVAEPQRQPGEVVPISRNLTLVQLTDRTCKWPLGDPLSADFRFCGCASGDSSPYCSYHSKLAFQPVSERRRAR